MEWISVNDRLPEDGKDVLAVIGADGDGCCRGPYCLVVFFRDGKWSELIMSEAYDCDIDKWKHDGIVTYWMPLPTLPKV